MPPRIRGARNCILRIAVLFIICLYYKFDPENGKIIETEHRFEWAAEGNATMQAYAQ